MMKRGTSFTKMIEDSKHLIKGSNWGLMENLSKLINVHNNIRSQNVILHRSGHHHQSHIANRTYSYTVRVIREMGNYLYSPFNPSHLRALGMARPLALLTHHEHTHPLHWMYVHKHAIKSCNVCGYCSSTCASFISRTL